MSSKFNAPVFAFLLALGVFVPEFFSISWWPPAGVFLFGSFVLSIIGLVQGHVVGSVIMLLILFATGPFRLIILPLMHSAEAGHQRQQPTSAQFSGGENSTPEPAASTATSVAASQQFAVQKHPMLAVKDSPLNTAFVARYARWKQSDDPRLQQPNWPEVLADDCSEHP